VEEYGIPIVADRDVLDDPDAELVAKICDKSSTVYNMSYALGCAVAPLVGGALND
jgi:hypothetical protein